MTVEELANLLRDKMHLEGLTQTQAAEASGVSQTFISRLLRHEIPTMRSLQVVTMVRFVGHAAKAEPDTIKTLLKKRAKLQRQLARIDERIAEMWP